MMGYDDPRELIQGCPECGEDATADGVCIDCDWQFEEDVLELRLQELTK